MSYLLQAFGMHLRSDLFLPGAVPDDPKRVRNDEIRVVFGHRNVDNESLYCPDSEAVRDFSELAKDLGPYRLEGDQLLFTQPGVATYRCRLDGRAVEIEPSPDASEEDLAAYCEATVLPALLWLARIPVLHAAAALLPGREAAVALAGASGVGKSTLLRALLAAGACCVGDDAVALRPDPRGGTELSGLPATTYLRTADDVRRQVPVACEQQVAAARIGVLVELVRQGPVVPQRQRGAAALAAVLRNLHRARIARLLGLEAELLPELARLGDQVPVWRWDGTAAFWLQPHELAEQLERLLDGF